MSCCCASRGSGTKRRTGMPWAEAGVGTASRRRRGECQRRASEGLAAGLIVRFDPPGQSQGAGPSPEP